MSIKHKKALLRMSILSATTLAASSAWGGNPFTQNPLAPLTPKLGTDYLTLDEMPKQHVATCMSEKPFSENTMTPSDITVVIDAENAPSTFQLEFTISDMIDSEEDRMLFLIMGTRASPSPEIQTHPGGPVLGLALAEMDTLGMYQIPKIVSQAQSESIVGRALPFAASKMAVRVNFDEHKIAKLMSNNKGVIYIQAGLIRVSELEQGIFENMILSEVDTITLMANKCPAETDIAMKTDNSGNLETIDCKTEPDHPLCSNN